MSRIMIVDDDEQLRMVLRAILEQERYQIIEADSGKKCLAMLKEGERPDLILLDVMMPELDGWETCNRIKKDKKTKDITVAMLTIKSQDPDKMKSLGAAGADWHITKPIEKDRFLKSVKWLLKKS